MQIAPPVRIQARTAATPPRWEVTIRYIAAYSCTLIAVAAAQLRMPTSFALALAGITLLGLPVSLYLRATKLRIGRYQIYRPLLNSTVVVIAAITSLYRFRDIVPQIPRPYGPDISQFLVRFNTEYPFEVLMQVFLLFAVWRCLAIISDSDAVLCALASFPVLLLLIVVHKGYEVVAYFLLWALMSAILFALDHRMEARQGVVGRLPSVVPGQDVKLSARSLATVLGFSLVCAMILSYTLTSREAEERSKAETWLAMLASRLTRLALDIPEAAVNSGPERQIDFTSAPSLPSRKPLWYVQAITSDRNIVRPLYWRMFTLGKYDGSTWSQIVRSKEEEVYLSQLPVVTGLRSRLDSYPMGSPYPRPGRGNGSTVPGFNIAAKNKEGTKAFGAPRRMVWQTIVARTFNYGFVPILPSAQRMRLFYGSPDVNGTTRINARRDNSAEVGVLDPGGGARVVSAVPPGPEYGGNTGGPPRWRDQRPNPQVKLSSREYAIYLTLPKTVPQGSPVRKLAQQLASKGNTRESDYMRAKRLEMYLVNIGTYTLRPPATPADQDAVEYFIFKSRRGYCTYFASALAVLCRAAGMPARVVTGFVNPEWRADIGASIINESNAHAWTEVWVPNWGWATLDATPPDDRGNNAPRWWDAWAEAATLFLNNGWLWILQNRALATVLLICLLNVVLVIIAWRMGLTSPRPLAMRLAYPWLRWWAARRGRLNDDTTRHMIFQAYGQASKVLARRFRQRAPWETPVEWLQAAESALELRDPEPLRRLTNLYAQAKYSTANLDAGAVSVAHDALSHLSWQRSR